MLYRLHELAPWWAGANLFRYVTVRAAGAAATAFLLAVVFGPRFIRWLQARRIHEDVAKPDSRTLEELSRSKAGTPTMGGLLILGSLLAATFLWVRPGNLYVLLAVGVMAALGALGFADDRIKLLGRGKGLSIRRKLAVQTLIGLAAAAALLAWGEPAWRDALVVPLVKPNLFRLSLGWFFVPFAALVIVGASNAVNLTDGMDGLAAGCGLIVALTYTALAYVAGHAQFAAYLQVPHVPGSSELVVLCAASAGALLGFLWFNAHPAQLFMGDTGSLPLGGLVAVVALVVKQELLLILVGGVFVMEALSVLLQVASFRLWGRRIFRIAPLHHHFQFAGWSETKVVTRFWILGILFALAALCTLKVR